MKNFEEELIKNQPPVKANELLAEIMPLIDGYFTGEMIFDGNGIIYVLPNGQKFILTAKEVA